jgi:hypothetical protein
MYTKGSQQRLGNGRGGSWCLARSLAAVGRATVGRNAAVASKGRGHADRIPASSLD